MKIWKCVLSGTMYVVMLCIYMRVAISEESQGGIRDKYNSLCMIYDRIRSASAEYICDRWTAPSGKAGNMEHISDPELRHWLLSDRYYRHKNHYYIKRLGGNAGNEIYTIERHNMDRSEYMERMKGTIDVDYRFQYGYNGNLYWTYHYSIQPHVDYYSKADMFHCSGKPVSLLCMIGYPKIMSSTYSNNMEWEWPSDAAIKGTTIEIRVNAYGRQYYLEFINKRQIPSLISIRERDMKSNIIRKQMWLEYGEYNEYWIPRIYVEELYEMRDTNRIVERNVWEMQSFIPNVNVSEYLFDPPIPKEGWDVCDWRGDKVERYEIGKHNRVIPLNYPAKELNKDRTLMIEDMPWPGIMVNNIP